MATTPTSKPKSPVRKARTATRGAVAPRTVRKASAPKAPIAEPVPPVAAVAATPDAVEAVAAVIETTAAETAPLAEAVAEKVVEVAVKTPVVARKRAVKAVKAAETAVETVEKAVERTAKAGSRSAATVVKAGADTMKKTFEQAFATSKEKYETVMQNFSDISAIGRENVDAVVSAGTVFAKGIEAVNAELAAISKRNLEDSIAAVKALAAAKSAKEYFELQSDLMKTSWDHMVADTTKLGEMMGEYSKDAMAPIQSRITAAMEKLSKPLAL